MKFLHVLCICMVVAMIESRNLGRQCGIQIKDDIYVPRDNLTVAEGDAVILVCDGSCYGTGYTPALRWMKMPEMRVIPEIPARVFTSMESSHRIHKLYIQDFGRQDVGTYKCRGWTGHWNTKDIKLEMKEVTVEETDTNTETDMSEDSDETPHGETPVETPHGERPVETPHGETPVETPNGETPIETPNGERPISGREEVSMTREPTGEPTKQPTRQPSDGDVILDYDSILESELQSVEDNPLDLPTIVRAQPS
ncbi:hypothetical protein ScPMuIL_008262 [Solemya velum]